MSKVTQAFKNKKAFIAFITCGDPSLEVTEQLIISIANAGADIIELGIPFSDPTAEGPIIQKASLRALKNHTTADDIFDMVRRVRSKVSVPLVFMTYANIVFSYGTERFIKTAAEIGMNGLILPDIPFEEKDEFAPVCKQYGIDFIPLISPTSKDRISMISQHAEGFVYCVSSLGVTGTRDDIASDVGNMVKLVKSATNVPTAIGFGIATPQQAVDMAKKADGVIVGSAIVKIIDEYGEDSPQHVFTYVKKMVDAIK